MDDRFVLRTNEATEEQVLYVRPVAVKPRDTASIATTRGGGRARTESRPERDASCPFCPGNEAQCSELTAQLCDAGGAWTARCFANRFPIFYPPGTGGAAHPQGLNIPLRAAGQMEVIVCTRRHDAALAEMAPADAGALVVLARDRARHLLAVRPSDASKPSAKQIRIFCNHGARAGGSLLHAHWQCVAVDFVPPEAARFAAAQARCAADPVAAVLAENIVYEDELVVAAAVVAAQAGTVWVAPRACLPCLEACDDATAAAMGAAFCVKINH